MIKQIKAFMGLDGPAEKDQLLTVADRRRLALRPPSFTALLPYTRYAPEEKQFVMEDGVTHGALFELSAVATEAQPMSYLVDRCSKVKEALHAIPEMDDAPWIVQCFLHDDRNIDGMNQVLSDYILNQHKQNRGRGQEILNSEYTQSVLQGFKEHFEQISRPQGLFTDTLVTGQPWRGQQRRVYCCIYRSFLDVGKPGQASVTQQMDAVANTLMATLTEAGVGVRRCNGRDFYEWMLPFFNRHVPSMRQ